MLLPKLIFFWKTVLVPPVVDCELYCFCVIDCCVLLVYASTLAATIGAKNNANATATAEKAKTNFVFIVRCLCVKRNIGIILTLTPIYHKTKYKGL